MCDLCRRVRPRPVVAVAIATEKPDYTQSEVVNIALECVMASKAVKGDAYNEVNELVALEKLRCALNVPSVDEIRQERAKAWATLPSYGVLAFTWDAGSDEHEAIVSVITHYGLESDKFVDNTGSLWDNARKLTKKEIEAFMIGAE